jgi:hypothetical protein
MFNKEIETIKPKTDVTEPCGMTIGLFPEEQIELPLEDEDNES